MFDKLRGPSTAVAVACVAALLAACGTSGGNSTGAKGKTSGVTLTVTSLSGPQQAGVSAVVADFAKVHPEIHIKASYVPGPTLETIVPQVAAGNAPDLLMVFAGSGAVTAVGHLAQAGLLADLSDQPWVSRIPAPFRSSSEYQGKTYMFPGDYSMMGMLYNKDLFAKYGVTPPQTLNDLYHDCAVFKSHGVAAIALGLKEPPQMYFQGYPMITSTVFSADPNWAQKQQSGQTTFAASADWHAGLSQFQSLESRGCFNSDVLGYSNDDSLRMVANGKAAMTAEVIEYLATLKSYNTKAHFGMIAYPGNNDPAKVWIPVGAQPGFAITKQSKHQAAAKIFLDFFNSPAENRKFSAAAGGLPTVDASNPTLPSGAEPMAAYLSSNRTAPFLDEGWLSAGIQPAFQAGVQELFNGKTSVDQILKSMDAASKSK